MLAVVKEHKGEGFTLKDVPVPQIGPDDVLIKVKAVGICGSDMPIFAGIREVPIPMIPGHEFSGIIEEIGSNVNKFKVGDRVTPGLVINCGECIYCRQGHESLCENIVETGIHVDGAFAEYVKVPAKTVHILPDTMTFEQAASIDPIASAYRPVKKANIGSEDTVLVFGPGPIGIYTVQCAKAEGAKRIIIAGVNGDEERLELAKKLGADEAINISNTDLVQSIRDINEGQLPDIVFEASGHPSSVQMCLDTVRANGQIVFIGIQHQSIDLEIAKIVRQEIKVEGSICYTWKDYKECIDLVSSGRVDTDNMVTHEFALKDIGKGIEVMKNREAVKVILHP
ncbi:L-iditol 2-dehydrogenase [Dethiosulfatibacter aminovorans DSM 17477]|uniref:L-iditol 2-dehydrogenase n=1 Tax=Dethiosulfatibacter aminovorans DSM 17477 TaxID=1121476 RepID=A0A1M6ML96_9FIRM|nr:alcohol dehydrogenase catalytic domain-containing protein [Dethiosulfatibacter aminovorans]SHJ84176.1 L-iditol 2-dehydrogenase [Dethiosulfatibacter aminovorans DSM 17477]